MAAIRVLLVDDAQPVRKRLCLMLGENPEFEVVAEASSASEAIEKAKQYQPDVVLLDISMPDLNGLQATPFIKNAAPESEILIVTQYANRFFAREAFAVGVRGFLNKSDAGVELLKAVTVVFSKKRFVGKSLQPTVFDSSDEELSA
jgi:DNA-binding NarL/FixJ family response regulator